MAESSTRVPSLAHLSAVLGTEDYAILRTENYASPPPHKTLHAVYCASTRTDVPRPPRHSAGADTRLQQRLHTEPPRKGPAAHRGQRPAQVQPRAPLRQHRRHAEAGEHGAGAQQRREQQRRVDGQRGRDQRAQRGALAERRAAQQQVPARREAAASGADGPRSRSAPPAQSPAGQRDTQCRTTYKVGPLHMRSRPGSPCRALPCHAMRAGGSCCRSGSASAACCTIRRPDELGLARGASGVCAPLVQVAGAGLQRRQPGGAADKAQHAQHRAHARHPVEDGPERGQPERAGKREVHLGEVLLHRARPARGAAWGQRTPRNFMTQAPLASVWVGYARGTSACAQRSKLEQCVGVEAGRAPSHPVHIVHGAAVAVRKWPSVTKSTQFCGDRLLLERPIRARQARRKDPARQGCSC